MPLPPPADAPVAVILMSPLDALMVKAPIWVIHPAMVPVPVPDTVMLLAVISPVAYTPY